MLTNTYTTQEELINGFQEVLADDRSGLLQARCMADPTTDFARSVARGLNQRPRQLECRFLYDARGSTIYEDICSQPEYYPTRTEAAILARYASEIRDITGPVTLLELGSGSSTKTDYLLHAYSQNGLPAYYVPIDVSKGSLLQAGRAITIRRPHVQVIGVHATYEEAMPLLGIASPAMVIFLGSSIGNLTETETDRFWTWISSHLQLEDFFLLGADLIKDIHLLEAAYNDAAGVTEAFTRNYFTRMNRELGCNIDTASVKHLAHYSAPQQQVEIHAGFTRSHEVYIPLVDESFTIDAGEKILVEICRKFRISELLPHLNSFGFDVRRVFTDERKWFSLLLLQKTRENRTLS